jgi:hypothetical protein
MTLILGRSQGYKTMKREMKGRKERVSKRQMLFKLSNLKTLNL